MKLELEAKLSTDTVKQSIDDTVNEAINSFKRTEKQEQLLVYIANYVRSNGELVKISDLKELFEDSVCEYAVHPLREKVYVCRKRNTYGGYILIAGVNLAIVLFAGFSLFAPISVGLGCWFWSNEMKKLDKKTSVALQLVKNGVANNLYNSLSEQAFKEMFDSVIEKYQALKEGKYV
ncbi:hypothetical protein HY484_02500 [Candidatus Woesearchaeota archaeon]|nr:hypothetical protein [Candidatus Woesearchaeota archaeon]